MSTGRQSNNIIKKLDIREKNPPLFEKIIIKNKDFFDQLLIKAGQSYIVKTPDEKKQFINKFIKNFEKKRNVNKIQGALNSLDFLNISEINNIKNNKEFFDKLIADAKKAEYLKKSNNDKKQFIKNFIAEYEKNKSAPVSNLSQQTIIQSPVVKTPVLNLSENKIKYYKNLLNMNYKNAQKQIQNNSKYESVLLYYLSRNLESKEESYKQKTNTEKNESIKKIIKEKAKNYYKDLKPFFYIDALTIPDGKINELFKNKTSEEKIWFDIIKYIFNIDYPNKNTFTRMSINDKKKFIQKIIEDPAYFYMYALKFYNNETKIKELFQNKTMKEEILFYILIESLPSLYYSIKDENYNQKINYIKEIINNPLYIYRFILNSKYCKKIDEKYCEIKRLSEDQKKKYELFQTLIEYKYKDKIDELLKNINIEEKLWIRILEKEIPIFYENYIVYNPLIKINTTIEESIMFQFDLINKIIQNENYIYLEALFANDEERNELFKLKDKYSIKFFNKVKALENSPRFKIISYSNQCKEVQALNKHNINNASNIGRNN